MENVNVTIHANVMLPTGDQTALALNALFLLASNVEDVEPVIAMEPVPVKRPLMDLLVNAYYAKEIQFALDMDLVDVTETVLAMLDGKMLCQILKFAIVKRLVQIIAPTMVFVIVVFVSANLNTNCSLIALVKIVKQLVNRRLKFVIVMELVNVLLVSLERIVLSNLLVTELLALLVLLTAIVVGAKDKTFVKTDLTLSNALITNLIPTPVVSSFLPMLLNAQLLQAL